MAELIVGVGETYPNLKSVESVAGSGDIISLTDTGEIDDSGSGLINFISLTGLTIRSKPTNTNKATVKLPGVISQTLLLQYMEGVVLINEIKFYADTLNQSNLLVIQGPTSGNQIIDSCEFYTLSPASGTWNTQALQLSSSRATVKNCIFHDLPGNAFELLDYYSTSGYDEILNNIIYNFGILLGSPRYGIRARNNGSGNIAMLNNIIHGAGNAGTTGIYIQASGSVIQDYNTIHACAIEYAGSAVTASHNRDSTQTPSATDPLIKNPSSGNLRLNINSPCIDAGAGTGVYSGIPTVDFMDSTRPYVWADKSSVDNGTDMGAYEMNPSYYSANTFDQTSAAPNQQITSTLDRDWVVHQVQAAGTDTYFDTTGELSSVIVRYTHEDNRQRKTIVHSGPGLQGETSWPTGARDGTWEKTEVISYDANGAKRTLLRSDIGTEEDIAMTDGTMNLNS